MTKNCKFDHFSSCPFSTNSMAVPVDTRKNIPLMDVTTYSSTRKNHQHEVIISLNGRVLVCDMTELQARAIILFATRGMEERKNAKDSDLELCNCLLQSQIYGSPSLSMKRSLQRFLQKRRQRSLASSPYNQ